MILNGEMAEWLKAHAWKACVGETLPWVRIPLSPPISTFVAFDEHVAESLFDVRVDECTLAGYHNHRLNTAYHVRLPSLAEYEHRDSDTDSRD